MSIRIRDKNGDVIDLEKEREMAADQLSYSLGQCRSARIKITLIDVLGCVLNASGTVVRKRAGVIEEAAS